MIDTEHDYMDKRLCGVNDMHDFQRIAKLSGSDA